MKTNKSNLGANLISTIVIPIILIFLSPSVFAQYPAGSPVAMNGKLKVVGTKLTSECGNPVQLRGMSSHGLQWFGNCNTSSALDALTNTWQVDIFRLAMYVQEGGYITNPSSWKTTIDNYVDQCGTRGIYCLIDWHVLTPGDPNANITESRDFWTYMATKHGSKKHVLYEICNEPNGVTWATVKTYANDIIPRIRAIDPNTVIIVGTPNWSQDVDVASKDQLSFTNIMYTLHFYSGSHAQSFRDKGNTAMSNGAAIFVTEWGTSQASGNGGTYLTEADNWISWMATNKISWCNWSFSDNTESSAALISGSCAGSNWNNTSTSGTYVKGKLTGTADNFTNCGSTTNQLPTVVITSPANNTIYTAPASITINATATDPDGTITKVDFYNGTTLLGSDASSPYSYSWTNVAAGTYTITAKATDNSGGITTSTAITVVVNVVTNQLPSVTITSPSNNTIYTAPASITFNATATDPDGTVTKVDFYNGSTLLGSDASSPYSYSWTNVAAGTYTITAKATDNSGGVTTSTAITVVVNVVTNQLPSVTITAPSNNAIYNAPASSITFTATATDPDGTITKVDFYNGSTLLGSDASSPYSYSWTNVAAGTYTITAIATDNSGGTTTSSAITIIVSVPQGPYTAGTPIPIPGTVESELYDLGGQGVAYNDADPANNGGQFRTDGVDIETCTDAGGGYSIGYTAAGEWLEYTVNVTATGIYNFNARVASILTGKTLHVEMNGVNVTGTMAVPNTGGYQTWSTITVSNINLTIGNNQIMRVYFDTDGINLNYVSVTAVNQAPTVSVSSPANNSTYCAGISIPVTATATDADGTISKVDFYDGTTLLGTITTSPYTYNWANAGTGIHNITAKATDNSTAITTSTSISITVNANPSAPTVTPQINYCQNSTGSALTATGGALKWYSASIGGTGSTTAPTPVTTVLGTINYYVSQTLNSCESPRATIGVTVNAVPSAPIVNASVSYCQNATASVLTATGSSLLWYTSSSGGVSSATAPTPLTTAIGTANYYVSQTTNGCESARAMIIVTINTAATATITTSGPITFCQGGNVTLSANSGASYIWFNGSSQVGTSSTYTANTSGNYTVQITNPSGCQGQVISSATSVIVNPLPVATITPSGPTTFCEGLKVDLVASTGSSYVWFNGTTQVGTGSDYSTSTAGNYTVQVTNANNCKATSPITTVTVNSLPTATITSGSSTTFCQGGTVTLTASAGTSYIWYNGTSQIGTSASYIASSSGSFTVKITNASNCQATSSVTSVTVNSPATATITASGSTAFCQGGSVTLSANTGTSYIWYNGNTQVGTNATYNAAISGSYTVQVTSNCQATSPVTVVTVNALPTATIIAGGPTTFSLGGSVLLSANAGAGLTYKWFNGSVQVGTNSTYTATTGGNYTVEVTNASACKSTSTSITVTVNGNQLPIVNMTAPANNTMLTAPANVILSATASDPDGTIVKVDFYNGNTLVGTDPTSTYSFALNNLPTGTYTITAVATDNLGAINTSAAITITVINQLPSVNITAPVDSSVYIANATVTIDVSATDANGTITKVEFYSGTTLLGSDVSSPYSFTWANISAGTYTITAKATDNEGGVSTSSAIIITVNANQASNIIITSPTNNSTITGTSVTINVTATDPDGSITLVEYYDGTTLIGSSTAQPFSLIWNNPTAGTHIITVKVTDSNGGVTSSSPTTVVINTPTGILSGHSVFTNVYPNPSNETFTLKSSEEIKDLWIINMFGIEMSGLQNIQAGQQIEIGKELPEGTFVLLIKYASDKIEVAKIVKIK